MQYSQEHLKTMVYAEFGGQTECIMGNWKIENSMDQEQIIILQWTLVLGIKKFYFKDAKKCLFLLKGCLNKCVTENKRIFFSLR